MATRRRIKSSFSVFAFYLLGWLLSLFVPIQRDQSRTMELGVVVSALCLGNIENAALKIIYSSWTFSKSRDDPPPTLLQKPLRMLEIIPWNYFSAFDMGFDTMRCTYCPFQITTISLTSIHLQRFLGFEGTGMSLANSTAFTYVTQFSLLKTCMWSLKHRQNIKLVNYQIKLLLDTKNFLKIHNTEVTPSFSIFGCSVLLTFDHSPT